MKTKAFLNHLLPGERIFHFDLRSSSVATRQTENEFSFALAAPSVPFSIIHLNRVWGWLLLAFFIFSSPLGRGWGWAVTASAQEAYACYTENNTTLTFYYDTQRSTRTGTTYDLNTGDNAPAWYTDGINANITKVVFNSSFANARPTSTYCWFKEMNNLTTITDLEYLNTSEVTNMGYMFYYCNALTALDLSSFNTANVTDMNNMFYYCSSLTTLDLSSFNTANVTDMKTMFCGSSKLTSLDLTKFNTQNVTNMSEMFLNCSGLTTVITHRKNIMEKLGMKSVSALTIYAVMHGYVDINKI